MRPESPAEKGMPPRRPADRGAPANPPIAPRSIPPKKRRPDLLAKIGAAAKCFRSRELSQFLRTNLFGVSTGPADLRSPQNLRVRARPAIFWPVRLLERDDRKRLQSLGSWWIAARETALPILGRRGAVPRFSWRAQMGARTGFRARPGWGKRVVPTSATATSCRDLPKSTTPSTPATGACRRTPARARPTRAADRLGGHMCGRQQLGAAQLRGFRQVV